MHGMQDAISAWCKRLNATVAWIPYCTESVVYAGLALWRGGAVLGSHSNASEPLHNRQVKAHEGVFDY